MSCVANPCAPSTDCSLSRLVLVIAAACVLTACETPTTQRYAISADNNQAIKALNASGVGLGTFAAPAHFDANCRALGPLQVADGLSHTDYIRKAFEDGLKIAGAFADGAAKVSLNGKVNKLEFSSSRGLTGGSWTIFVFKWKFADGERVLRVQQRIRRERSLPEYSRGVF